MARKRVDKVLTVTAEGFEDFLSNFKLSGEAALAHQMNAVSIEEEDGLSDEYDFMDDEPEARAREKAKQSGPIHKYRDMLQLVANRKQSEIIVDLDDIASVSWPRSRLPVAMALTSSTSTVREGHGGGAEAAAVSRGQHQALR
jgi:hypothetical protein